MNQVQLLDTVLVSYTARLVSGEVIEQTTEDKPITVRIGSGRILKAVEASMLGMTVGESKTVHILPEDAYGPHRPELVHEVSRSLFAGRIDPKPGMLLSLSVEREGASEQVPATVLAAGQKSITVDYNHPLAGKTITYTVKLHAIGN